MTHFVRVTSSHVLSAELNVLSIRGRKSQRGYMYPLRNLLVCVYVCCLFLTVHWLPLERSNVVFYITERDRELSVGSLLLNHC